MRCQPPVHSPLVAAALMRGAAASVFGAKDELTEKLKERQGARDVSLFDSGTAALAAAMELAAPGRSPRIACPAYVCVDVGAAIVASGAQLVLYDTDPLTLSPDLGSLRGAIGQGVDAVVVAHLFGIPCDMDAVVAMCRELGALVIEDAAQEAGASFSGRRLGAFGDLTVLSFGRGKGVTGGGGALLVPSGSTLVQVLPQRAGSRGGGREFLSALAQWMLARPALYAIPSSITWLQLGEMVYYEVKSSRTMARSSAAIVSESLHHEQSEAAQRCANAARLAALCASSDAVQPIRPGARGTPSYLRFPILIDGNTKSLPRCLGVARGYPRLLYEQPEVANCLRVPNTPQAGALRLRDSLVTLPTHSLLTEADFRALRDWLGSLN